MQGMRVLVSILAAVLFLGGVAEGEWQTTGSLEGPRAFHTSTVLPSGKVLVVGGSNIVPLSSAEIYDPSTGTWSHAGNLAEPRYGHTATLLASGRVLVVGGHTDNSGTSLSSAEVYDPNLGTWSVVGSLTTPRVIHTATLLPSGRVLVIGGRDGFDTALSSAEIYDPATETWSEVEDLDNPREYHTATLLSSGQVLVIGGRSVAAASSAEIYDPGAGTWTNTENLSTSRYGHTATLLASGRVLVVGGYGDFDLVESAAEIYDPSSGTWSATGSLTTPRSEHTATLLPSGRVLVAGGRDAGQSLSNAEIYDPSTEMWLDGGELVASRGWHTTTLLPSGQVLIAGGFDGGSLSSAEIYQPSSGIWVEAEDLTTPRSGHTSTLLPTGEVLVVGGFEIGLLPSVEIYDPSSGMWRGAEGLTVPRSGHTATLLRTSEVLVIGGFDNDPLSSVEIYDSSAGTWSEAEDLATARSGHTSTLLPTGEILVVGGFNSGPLSSVEIYDPDTEMWTEAEDLLTPRSGHTSTLLPSGRVLVVGGSGSSGSVPSVEIYDPSTGAWMEAEDLAVPRSGHTSTLLPSGAVLVIGGASNGDFVSITEIYDPSTGAWTLAGNHFPTRRTAHTSTLLPSGKVIVVGGWDGMRLSNAEIYDPSTGAWTAAGNLATPRDNHTLTLLPSGQALVVAGHDESETLSSAEIYQISPPPESRRPTIQLAPEVFHYGHIFAIIGLFRADSEASGGTTRSSAFVHPTFTLRSLDGSRHHRLVPDPQTNVWDAPRTLTLSQLPPGIDPGPHLLTVTVAGVPSEPVFVEMACSLAITRQPTDQIVGIAQTATFAVETQGGRRFQWQKDGIDIPGATGPTYTTPPVTVAEDGTRYRVLVDGGCSSEGSATAELIIDDDIPPEVEIIHPSGGEYWLLTDPDDPPPPNTELITWSMSDNVRICQVDVELAYSDDAGNTWTAEPLETFGDAGDCPLPGVQTTSLLYEMESSSPSGVQGSLYEIRIHATDRVGNITSTESASPFYMTERGDDVRTLILTHSERLDMTPELSQSLQDLAGHPTVVGFLVDLSGVESVRTLYEAWDAATDADTNTITANAVLFAENGIHDHILDLLEVYPQVEHLIVVGDDTVIPMARLDDRTFRLPESEYAGSIPAGSTVQRALEDNRYLSDDPLATTHLLRPSQIDGNVHLADLSIGRLVETPDDIRAAIAAYIQQDGYLDLSLRNPKALVTGYDFLQDSALRIDSHWGNVYTPAEVDGDLISSDWGEGTTVEDRRNLLEAALAQGAGFLSLNGHATHAEEGVPGIDRHDIQGLPATNIAALPLTGCVVYAIGCHGGLPVPDEADLPQSFLRAGAAAYLAGSGYGWGLLEGIGLGERLAVILTEELAVQEPQSVGEAIRRSKERYYFENPRWDDYDIKTLHQPILYGFPMYTLQADAQPPSASLRTTRNEALDLLPPHVTGVQVSFDFTAEGVYRKYDAIGNPTTDCPAEGCYYELNGLTSGESDLPIEPYFVYDSRLAGTSQHGILWLGGPYEKETDWTPIFARIASNDDSDIGQGSLPPRIALPRRGPRPTDPPDVLGECPVRGSEVNTVVFTTGEVAQAASDGPGEYSHHRLLQKVDLEVYYFNNQDDPSQNCDRDGPTFGEGVAHELLGTTLHWSVDVQDEAGVWRVLVLWDDEEDERWRPLELSYDASAGRWTGSLSAAGLDRLTYVLQAVDQRGNVAWKELGGVSLESGVPLGLTDVITVEVGPGEADLEATLVAPPTVDAATDFTARLSVSNHGPDRANQLTATLTLPAGMFYTFGSGVDWTCQPNASEILCTRDVLEVGESSDLFFQLVAPDLGGENLLGACAEAAEADPIDPSCDLASILVIDQSMTDLALVKEDGGVLAVPGEPLIYSITVGNLGSNPAFDAVVTDLFVPELTEITWSCTATVGSSCSPSGTGDISDVVDIAAGGTLLYIIHATVAPDAEVPIINTATVDVSSAMSDIRQSNNSDQVITHGTSYIFGDGFESGTCSPSWTACLGID